MANKYYIALGEIGSRDDGGGPDDPRDSGNGQSGSRGFLALAMGFSVGLTFALFFLLFRYMPIFDPTALGLAEWVGLGAATAWGENLLISFLAGFVGGTFIALIYNLLVVQRLNLLGLDR